MAKLILTLSSIFIIIIIVASIYYVNSYVSQYFVTDFANSKIHIFSDFYMQISYKSTLLKLPLEIKKFQNIILIVIGAAIIIGGFLLLINSNNKTLLFHLGLGLVFGSFVSGLYEMFNNSYIINYFVFDNNSLFYSFSLLNISIFIGIILLIIDLWIVSRSKQIK